MLVAQPVEQWQGSVTNDFEHHILASHPEIAKLKQAMLAAGATYAAMSGSGSAVFALFKDKPSLALDSEIFAHIEHIEA
jgi:4-diphosphocytidyl-2-C-methyl-D-erythritol kinase